MLTLHIHIDTYHALPCWQEARKLTCCTRSLPERRRYSVRYVMRNNSQDDDPLLSKSSQQFFPSARARKRSHQILKKNWRRLASHELHKRKQDARAKKIHCSPYSRPLHIFKENSCPRLPETSIFGETEQYITRMKCCVTQTVQQCNEARKQKYCIDFHTHACCAPQGEDFSYISLSWNHSSSLLKLSLPASATTDDDDCTCAARIAPIDMPIPAVKIKLCAAALPFFASLAKTEF